MIFVTTSSSNTLLWDGHHQLVAKKVEAVVFSIDSDSSEDDTLSLILHLDSGLCKLAAIYMNLIKNKWNAPQLEKALATLLFSSIFGGLKDGKF